MHLPAAAGLRPNPMGRLERSQTLGGL